MNLLEETKWLLRSNRIVPNRLLGQNFMIDADVLQSLIGYVPIDCDDIVLDIGAGFGFLSLLLSSKCKTVVAVERDFKIAQILRNQLANSTNACIIQGDIFQAQLPHFNKVASIPPYQISSKLLVWLFGRRLEVAVLILQKEFACRLVAAIGSDAYGWLSVLAYYYAEIEMLDKVSKMAFYPQPQVDSAIVRIRPKDPPPFVVRNKQLFTNLVRSLFTQRNRKVRNAILPFVKKERRFGQTNMAEIAGAIPNCDKRVRELNPENFGELANALTE